MPGLARSLVLGAVMAAAAAACGSGQPSAGDAPSSSMTPSSMARLGDGTVPWADLPADDDAFGIRPASTPSIDDGAPACSAEQLAAELTWELKGDNDEGKPRTPANGLVGTVLAQNHGQDCYLQGEVPTTLLSNGAAVKVAYRSEVAAAAAEQRAPVPSGGSAQMRVDWSAPFCGEAVSNQTLRIELPNEGGVLEAPAAAALQPGCALSETHPGVTSVVSSQPFEAYRANTPLDSAFNPVALTYDAPSAIASDADQLVFFVTLTNPTGAAIPLEPRPGYVCELGTEGTVEAPRVSELGLGFLNDGAIATLPPGPTRFEMRCPVPDDLRPGQMLDVRWQLLHRALKPEGKAVYFQVPVS